MFLFCISKCIFLSLPAEPGGPAGADPRLGADVVHGQPAGAGAAAR